MVLNWLVYLRVETASGRSISLRTDSAGSIPCVRSLRQSSKFRSVATDVRVYAVVLFVASEKLFGSSAIVYQTIAFIALHCSITPCSIEIRAHAIRTLMRAKAPKRGANGISKVSYVGDAEEVAHD
jgi:hypothetical protein